MRLLMPGHSMPAKDSISLIATTVHMWHAASGRSNTIAMQPRVARRLDSTVINTPSRVS